MNKSFNKELALTLAKFFAIILFLYLGKEYMISAIHPLGKYYSPFIQQHLNVPNWFRIFLLHSTDYLLQALGYTTVRHDPNSLRVGNSSGINLGFVCVGFGVMIFWVAFILADNYTSKMQKLKWLLLGLVSIAVINVVRLAVLTLAAHYKWWSLSAVDHHTIFNVVAYLFVFYLLFIHMRKTQTKRGAFSNANQPSTA